MDKKLVRGGCVFLLFFSQLWAQTAYLRTTIRLGDGTKPPYCTPWVDSGGKEATSWTSTSNYIEIFPNTTYQTILGWGGTIQEKHWEAMKVLSGAGKDSIMRELFDTSGCNISFLRLPIGCCDFDLNEDPISLNETAGDYEMKNFTLHRDSLRKIPLIKMAQAINPNIRFWGCPWSPPRWMHDNGKFDSGNMKSDSQTLKAYALYLEKFVLGYKEAGINVEWICCQNEPNITDGGYPKCGWSNSLELNFYKNYLIPLFKKDNISTRILLGVYCCGEYDDWITYFMRDQTVREFVGVTSHSYQNPDWGMRAYNDYPGIPFFQSEAPFHWPEDGIQDWSRGIEEFDNVFDFMNNRASVYHMWNMVNDETAKSGFNWAQNVMIQVHRTTKQVTYNPHFWGYKHFAYYVKAGAKAVKYAINGSVKPNKFVAFINPNGDIILVCSNYNNSNLGLNIKVDTKMWKVTLPANSFNTIRIAMGKSTVKEVRAEKTSSTALTNAMIYNSNLQFTLPPWVETQELNATLMDMQGRKLWHKHIKSKSLLTGKQTFALNSTNANLISGTYLLSVEIKERNGTVSKLEYEIKKLK